MDIKIPKFMTFLKQDWLIMILAIFFVLPTLAYASTGYGDVGFFTGFWQGITFPFRLFLKFIWTDMIIYNQFNSTYLYHVGYVIGIIIILGGSSRVGR